MLMFVQGRPVFQVIRPDVATHGEFTGWNGHEVAVAGPGSGLLNRLERGLRHHFLSRSTGRCEKGQTKYR